MIESRKETSNTFTVVYHNPRFLSVFEKNMQICKKETLHDALKDYDTCILEVCIEDMV